MASKYNEAELDALEKKMLCPDSVVYCPRCGKEFAYRSIGNSCEVVCPTEGCVKGSVRGL